MAEHYTAWRWRFRTTFGKRRMHTSSWTMDEQEAEEYFAKEGVTEYAKVENSAVARVRYSPEEAGELQRRNPLPGNPAPRSS